MSVAMLTRAPRTARGPLTSEEFLAQYPTDGRQELVAGYIVELPMPDAVHGDAAGWLVYQMKAYDLVNKTGRTLVGEVMLQTIDDPPSNRMMDVAWISRERWPERVHGILYVPPELAIEIKSPDDRKADIEEKEEEYFAAGVNVAMFVDPDAKTIRLRRPGGADETYGVGDTLTMPDIMPGFALTVADVFQD